MILTIQQAVAFAILMENDEGILNKSPDYIREKLEYVTDNDSPQLCLDSKNQGKYYQYMKRWAPHL